MITSLLRMAAILGVVYLVYRLIGIFSASAIKRQFRKDSPDSEAHFQATQKNQSQFDGAGEYVDYEEVK